MAFFKNNKKIIREGSLSPLKTAIKKDYSLYIKGAGLSTLPLVTTGISPAQLASASGFRGIQAIAPLPPQVRLGLVGASLGIAGGYASYKVGKDYLKLKKQQRKLGKKGDFVEVYSVSSSDGNKIEVFPSKNEAVDYTKQKYGSSKKPPIKKVLTQL